jgi:hypothetical protein
LLLQPSTANAAANIATLETTIAPLNHCMIRLLKIADRFKKARDVP